MRKKKKRKNDVLFTVVGRELLQFAVTENWMQTTFNQKDSWVTAPYMSRKQKDEADIPNPMSVNSMRRMD